MFGKEIHLTSLNILKIFYVYPLVFLCTGYATTGFSKTNSRLGNGYYEGTFGIAYKGFYRVHFLRRADGSKKYH